MHRKLFGRKRVLIAVIVAALAIAGTAYGAWLLLTGVNGSGGGKVGSSQISAAVSLTPHFQVGDTAVIPGSPGEVYADITNNNNNSNENITGLSASAITATPACDTSALSFSQTIVGHVVGAGVTQNHVLIGGLSAASNLDPACANSDLSITFTGTTSP